MKPCSSLMNPLIGSDLFQMVCDKRGYIYEWLQRQINDMETCYRLSFKAHFRLVTIHPWVDGNGRTSRLLMNIIQRQLGLIPSIVMKDVKGEYIQPWLIAESKKTAQLFKISCLPSISRTLKAGFYSKSINDTATRLIKAHRNIPTMNTPKYWTLVPDLPLHQKEALA